MQKLWSAVTLFVILSLVSACARQAGARSRVWDETEQAAVYSALIDHELAIPMSYITLGDTVLIVSSTYETSDYENISDDDLYAAMPGLDKETVEDFRAVNTQWRSLDLALSIGEPYAYIAEPMSYEDWMALRQNYPDASLYTMLSRVGFNPQMDQALVYMAHRCGDECGVGVIYFLVRRAGGWQVQNQIDAWYS